jgi:uncharacterized protein YndB with AHSA1/START domain
VRYDLTIERLVNAPTDVVFDAFVDPEAQQELYANEDDPSWVVESELDLRVGGTWTIAFGPAGQDPYRETNVFTEVDRPRRIVFESSMLMVDDGHTVATTVTVTFEDQNGTTLLTIHQSGFEREDDRDDIQGGWPGILDTLERVVSDERKGAGR